MHSLVVSLLNAITLAGLGLGATVLPASRPHGLTRDPVLFSSQTFDYVVVGGGTAGLTVAARLSENPDVTVGVIEAGELQIGNPDVDTPALAGQDFLDPNVSWGFTTVPLKNANDNSIIYPRGKMVGGSSGLNIMVWTRPSKAELDAWSELGVGGGWNWDGLLPFMMKAENVSLGPPLPGSNSKQASGFDSSIQGRNGPIQVGYNNFYSPLIAPFVESFIEVGATFNDDAENGNNVGVFNCQRSVDDNTGNRSYAATGYFVPNQERRNLLLLVGAMAGPMIFSEQHNALHNTEGVTFFVNGTTYKALANKEVILSAGAIQTPQILELSGIGNRTLLSNLGIKPLINLPTVGENLQDHPGVVIDFLLNNPAPLTVDALRNNATFAVQQHEQYLVNHTGLFTALPPPLSFHPLQSFFPKSRINSLVNSLKQELTSRSLSEFQKLQASIQLGWLERGSIAQVELIALAGAAVGLPTTPGDSYLSLFAYGQHMFSRGSVHINTTSPLAPPLIDPNYFDFDFDRQVLEMGIDVFQRVASTAPLSGFLNGISFPSPNELSPSQISGFISNTVSTEFHPIGTAALAPQQLGGVVGDDLIVYGTSNVRIVDASIIPMHVASHIQQVVYGIAEKAAVIISRSS